MSAPKGPVVRPTASELHRLSAPDQPRLAAGPAPPRPALPRRLLRTLARTPAMVWWGVKQLRRPRILLAAAIWAGMVFAGYEAAGIVFGFVILSPIERLFRRHDYAVARPELGTDLLHAILSGPLLAVFVIVPFLLTMGLFGWVPSTGFHEMVRSQPPLLLGIEALLISDFFGYWGHRAAHQIPLGWRFHKIHHSSQRLDWISGVRLHPGEALVAGFIQFAPVYALGFEGIELMGAAGILGLWGAFQHANVDWRLRPIQRLITTPEFHHWHHSDQVESWDKNFAGLLPIWDQLFGTYHVPGDARPRTYGVSEPIPATYWGQLTHPFRRTRRTLPPPTGAPLPPPPPGPPTGSPQPAPARALAARPAPGRPVPAARGRPVPSPV